MKDIVTYRLSFDLIAKIRPIYAVCMASRDDDKYIILYRPTCKNYEAAQHFIIIYFYGIYGFTKYA